MLNLRSPIPKHLNDPDWYAELWNKLKLVPYAGTSRRQAHRLIDFLYELFQNSPSKQICVNTKARFAFEGDVDIISKDKPGLTPSPDKTELTHAEKVQFCEFLEKFGLTLVDVKNLMADFNMSKEILGHAVMIIERFSIAGITKYKLSVPHGKHFAFIFPQKGDLWRSIVISKELSSMTKDSGQIEFEIVREYPAWTETATGKKTFFIDRCNSDDSDFYGRPHDISTLRWQYVEGQKADQACRISETDFIALYLLAMKQTGAISDDNEAEQFKDYMKTIRQLTTKDGKAAQGIVGLEVPFDVDMMPELYKLDVTRDSEYLEKVLDKASAFIHAANGLPRELTNLMQTRSSIGGNSYLDLFKVTEVNQIRPIQRWGEGIFDKILGIIGEEENEVIDKSIKFNSKLTEMIELFKDDKNINQQLGSQEIQQDRLAGM